mmetsp:Transcript_150119/g.279869  ORF Transcript_150119/g.279869 Transcript_150119/m.279869 type:complete len:504 (+) Transcript_150119:141-1652(+)
MPGSPLPMVPCTANFDSTPTCQSELAETTPACSELDACATSEFSWCSTCPPEECRNAAGCSFELDSPKAEKAARSVRLPAPLPASPSQSAAQKYITSRDLLGGGRAGIVQKAVHAASGREVAIKRLQRDARCPIRFLEVNLPGKEAFHAEGYAAVGAVAMPWRGSLLHDTSNEHAAAPFEAGSLEGCVVLARRGGGVGFADKVSNAACGGAAGLLLVNSAEHSEAYRLAGKVKPGIPSMMVGQKDGEALFRLLGSDAAKRAPISIEVRTDAEHEVTLCRRLPPHPNIIQVLDAWHEGDSMVVVSELCTGGKLAAPISGGAAARTLATILLLVKQILAGVGHLHEQGVCHRDIKAENMLLTRRLDDPQARLVLIDFSMASMTERMCVPCGSARYCAPEVISGKYGRERDVWSVGVVAYELLFGKHPFEASSDSEVLDQISNPDPCRVPERGPSIGAVSVELSDFLHRLLEKDPAKRATAAEALEHPALQDTQLPTHISSSLSLT